MKLASTPRRHRARRARSSRGACLLLSGLGWLALGGDARAQSEEAGPPPRPEDILKNIVVASRGGEPTQPLPRVAVLPGTVLADEDVTLRHVVKRDLELCGEFELMPDDEAPDGLYLSDTPVDVEAWRKKGAEAVVKVSGQLEPSGKVTLRGVAYLTDTGSQPVFEKRFETDRDQVRVESHRMADALIGALTGTDGGFSSQMTFVFGYGKARRVYVMDSDGHDPHAVSPPEHLALAPTFGPGHELYWTASIAKDRFKIFKAGLAEPIEVSPHGSVYGLAFSPARDKVAVSIAQGTGIALFSGPDLEHLSPAASNDLAMHPVWSPNGLLAFAGESKWGQRVFVDGKPISPAGLSASAPVFCRHPMGVRAIFTVDAGSSTHLVATGEKGGGTVRLTAGQSHNVSPACSPDGRLVAFFSNRTTGQGPGLYVMRLDGTRPKRISLLVGDSLRWARLPAGKAARLPAK